MMKHKFWTLLLGLSLILAACRTPAPETPEPTQADPNAVFTAAAQTAEAMMAEMAAFTPSPPAATVPPTEAPQATSTPQPTEAVPATSPTVAAAVTAGAVTTGDKAEFVSDVTVPDGTNFQPNETFIKTWQLQNAGTTTWTTSYSLVFVSGAQMNSPASVPLPNEVAPGGTVDISVNMTAPADPGSYRGYWNLQNTAGQFFGLGPSANEPVWVDIVVGGEGSTPGASTSPGTGGTPVAQITPSTSGIVITNATLSTDNPSVTGSCPHTFTFTAQFTVNKPATLTYRLEAGADNSGFTINVPEPATTTVDTGTHTLAYTLDFTNSLTGWARLHITAPVDVVSNQATFSLACQQ